MKPLEILSIINAYSQFAFPEAWPQRGSGGSRYSGRPNACTKRYAHEPKKIRKMRANSRRINRGR